MKAGKEEIIGMVAAMDLYFHKRDIAAEYRLWESWFAHITAEITRVRGVKTRVIPAAGASPFPVLEISWRSGITAGALYTPLLKGSTPIHTPPAGPRPAALPHPSPLE